MRNLFSIVLIMSCSVGFLFGQITIDPNGNIGVRNENPAWELDMSGRFQIKNATTSAAIILDMGTHSAMVLGAGNNAGIAFDDDFDFEIRSNARSSISAGQISLGLMRMKIKGSNGYVGIGTSSPLGKLHVTSVNYSEGLLVESTSANGSSGIRIKSSNETWGLISSNSNHVNDGIFSIYNDNAGQRFFNITPLGNVGIGLSTPSSKLHVLSQKFIDIPTFETSQSNSSSGLRIKSTDHTWSIISGNSANSYNGIFTVYHENSQSRYFNLTPAGNVGIGTQNPLAKLDIKSSGNGTSPLRIESGNNGNAILEITQGGVGNPNLFFGTDDGIRTVQIASTGTSYFNGLNFGIGTTAPDSKLTVLDDLGVSVGNKKLAEFKRFDSGTGNAGLEIGYGASGSAVDQTYIYIPGNSDFAISTFDNGFSEKLYIENTGNVGIGTSSPTETLTLGNGTASKPGGGDWVATSDRRSKKNIRSFEDGLDQVLQLNPVFYEYNGEFGTRDDGQEYVGVIAQEIQNIAPYTVVESKNLTSNGAESQYLKFDGTAIRYMLVNAVKEQQSHIKAIEIQAEQKTETIKILSEQIISFQSQLDQLTSLVNELSSNDDWNQGQEIAIHEVILKGENKIFMGQNKPNPFSDRTIIDYQIDGAFNSALVQFANAAGQIIHIEKIEDQGKGRIILSMEDFRGGLYAYSLVLDGEVVITKKMVFVE